MSATDFIYVDIETTGGNALRDRITEIAWIHVRDHEVIDQRAQLINPRVPIPYPIQQYTGITDAMVQDSPCFEEIADSLLSILSDKIFVAHNARFDYGFIRNALQRCGLPFSAPVLCTVKLSRRLYPQFKRHNLDSLIERHHLHCTQRHRAMGDARVMMQFVEQACREHGAQIVRQHIDDLLKTPALPPAIDARMLDELPPGPGVYIFYDGGDIPLYIGKSVRLRSRVLAHFSSDHRSAKDQRINQQLARIETRSTAGELGALLLEARLVKQLAPVHNRQLRRYDRLYTIRYDAADPDPGAVPVITPLERDLIGRGRALFGLFKSARQAADRLKKLARDNELCLKTLGLEQGRGPCFNYQLKKCRGVCAGQEAVLQHRLRLLQALTPLQLQRWPFAGAIAIRETSACGTLQELHLIDHWIYYGSLTAQSQLQPDELLQSAAAFDLDAYQILTRYLLKHANRLDIVQLPASSVMS